MEAMVGLAISQWAAAERVGHRIQRQHNRCRRDCVDEVAGYDREVKLRKFAP